MNAASIGSKLAAPCPAAVFTAALLSLAGLNSCTAEASGSKGISGSSARSFTAETGEALVGGTADELEGLGSGLADEETSEPKYIVLTSPTLKDWRPRLGPGQKPGLGPGPESVSVASVALATDFNAPVFAAPGQRGGVIGRVRRGHRLAVTQVSGSGCSGGSWYRLTKEQGYVCTSAGFEILEAGLNDRPLDQWQPDPSRPLPLKHGQVTTQGAPRLSMLPSEEEAALLDGVAAGEMDSEGLGALVVQRMVGDYFLAIDREVGRGDRRYYRTVKGHYVRAEDVELLEGSSMQGEHITEPFELPIAFVHVEETHLACFSEDDGDEALEVCGRAEQYARFEVARVIDVDGERWVESKEGFVAPRRDVRIAREIEPPERVPRRAKWAHINLKEQTLIAYEGTRPVFATLVTTGKEGYTTPAGLWRTNRKYLTRTMRGGNEIKGVYDVEEVPWAIYYNRGWAVHGAYWHDELGDVRSHGCTNLAPADARWVFYWSELEIPEGWHAVTGRQGTWWYFTRS